MLRKMQFRLQAWLYRHWHKRYWLVLVSLLLGVLCLIYGISVQLEPVLADLAEAEATDVVTICVNRAINEQVTAGNLQYDELVSLQTDEAGKISALVSNMANINRLQTAISNQVMHLLSDETVTRIYVPLGNLTGSSLFSAKGPDIPVDLLSVSNVDTNFHNEFESAGINQTRHQILLCVSVELTLLLPGEHVTTTVATEVTVAETIIVGTVPDTYADMY